MLIEKYVIDKYGMVVSLKKAEGGTMKTQSQIRDELGATNEQMTHIVHNCLKGTINPVKRAIKGALHNHYTFEDERIIKECYADLYGKDGALILTRAAKEQMLQNAREKEVAEVDEQIVVAGMVKCKWTVGEQKTLIEEVQGYPYVQAAVLAERIHKSGVIPGRTEGGILSRIYHIRADQANKQTKTLAEAEAKAEAKAKAQSVAPAPESEPKGKGGGGVLGELERLISTAEQAIIQAKDVIRDFKRLS